MPCPDVTQLPHVRVEMSLMRLSALYAKLVQVERVMGTDFPLPDTAARALALVRDVRDEMDAVSGGFLAPANL